MATSTQNVLEDVERRHAELQQQVARLRAALSHWATFEAEYQTLQAEIEAAASPSATRMRDIARALDGKLVTEQEMEELLGKNLQTKRSANVVVDLLSRRIDYVQQNSAAIEKQLDAAEKQLAGADMLLDPGMENDDGLPMMEIEEELDAEGHEVSSSLTRTGEGAAEMVEALRKFGAQRADLERDKGEQKKMPQQQAQSREDAGHGSDHAPAQRAISQDKPAADASTNPSPEDPSMEPSPSTTLEPDNSKTMVVSEPIIPQDESPEDAELRRQMLQYGLSEVGQIVAELDLDYPTALYSDEEEEGDDDKDEDEDDDDHSEDEFGRSTKSVLTSEYRKQMMELEQRLEARVLENLGPDPSPQALAEHIDDIRTMRVQDDDRFDESLDTSKPKSSNADLKTQATKKSVRFAEDVTDSEPAKVSRFMSSPKTAKQSFSGLPAFPAPIVQIPSGPPGRALASTITEHAPSSSTPLAPDEFDPATLHHEVQTEYHRARNKFIQQQGGFKAETGDDAGDDAGSMVEERDGKTRKVSRFKAARLRANGM